MQRGHGHHHILLRGRGRGRGRVRVRGALAADSHRDRRISGYAPEEDR